MNDLHRAAGRGGVGAVMGSKNLKAIAVGGSRKIPFHNQAAFMALSRRGAKKSLENARTFAKYGTTMVLALTNEMGALPTRNFRAGRFDRADEINGDALKSLYFIRNRGCYNCPLKCGNVHSVRSGPFAVAETEGPEYETLMSFGSNCGNGNLASIIKANDMCNDLGMDTITAGNTIALLLDLHQNGLVGQKVEQGLNLGWGDANTIVKLVEMIAYRRGIGDILAEGSARAAAAFGKECEKYTIHSKCQEFPGYEPRRVNGTGLSFATSSRGADHLRACLYVNEVFQQNLNPYGFSDDKIQMLVEKENVLALVDSLVMCKFGQRNGEFTMEVLAEMLKHLIGTRYSTDELYLIGERVYNLERLYNLSAGVGPDILPERLFKEDLDDPLEKGHKLARDEFENAIAAYYKRRNWDSSGTPSSEKLIELGLKLSTD
jgi:aldehyde:ferredoxin oxidoreductase